MLLLIPVVIFLFLKFFGENRFDIPIYYQTAQENPFSDCPEISEWPYTVKGLDDNYLPALFLFYEADGSISLLDIENIIQRLDESVEGITNHVYTTDSALATEYDVTALSERSFNTLRRCALLTDTLNQYILVDTKKQIRGYYGLERDEIDRLIVELKILLENERSDGINH